MNWTNVTTLRVFCTKTVISSLFMFHSFYIRCCVLLTGFSTRIYDDIWWYDMTNIQWAQISVPVENRRWQPTSKTYDTILYDKKSLTWTRKLSIQLYLAHVARKKETKTNKRQCPFNAVHWKHVSSLAIPASATSAASTLSLQDSWQLAGCAKSDNVYLQSKLSEWSAEFGHVPNVSPTHRGILMYYIIPLCAHQTTTLGSGRCAKG